MNAKSPFNRLLAGFLILFFICSVGLSVPANVSTYAAIQRPSTDGLVASSLYPATEVRPSTTAGKLESSTGLARYIVQFESPPLATYSGGISGLRPTSPLSTGEAKLNANSAASVAYLAYLDSEQTAVLSQIEGVLSRPPEMVYHLQVALNAVVLLLDEGEAARLAGIPGVKMVERDYASEIVTDAGPAWIGAPSLWNGTSTGGLPGTKGEGIIVGILDTGINMDHPSFAASASDGYVHTNPFGSGNFVGWCDPGNPNHNPSYVCNSKLIGAWDYADASSGEGDGPEDGNGHGSHVASTVAGNPVSAPFTAPTVTITRTISGVAPRANIIAYDVCKDSCLNSDVVAALNQAIVDGVDVTNESIGIGGDTWSGAKQQAYLSLYAAGIVAVRAAGNSGPGPATVGPEPVWTISTAATTHNRQINNGLNNMSGGSSAPSGNMFGLGLTSGFGPAKIVYAGDFGSALCEPGAFAPGTFSGEIVVCDRGLHARVAKGQSVLDGGAGGMVLADDGNGLVADPHVLPAVHISQADGAALKTWLAGGSNHMATIAGYSINSDAANGDRVAGFSSRGPGQVEVIKPDIAAPGFSILAAVNTTNPSDPPEYGLISGTSMASPHMAGAAALLRDLHPAWSPSQVRSALMTTATITNTLKEDWSTPTDPFDLGAGRVDLTRASKAGLLLDVTTAQFQAAASTGEAKSLNLPSMQSGNCYQACSWTRTVTNPTNKTMTWSASYLGPGEASISPASFSINPGQSRTFTFELSVLALPQNSWQFGRLVWTEASGQAPAAGLPVAAYVSGSTDSSVLIKGVDRASAKKGDSLQYTISLANKTSNLKTFNLTDPIPGAATYVPGSATGGLVHNASNGTLTWSGSINPSALEIIAASPGTFMSMGATLPLGCPSNCDDGGFVFTGLDFYYLGEHYTSAILSVNGTLEAGSASLLASPPTNTILPNASPPNNLLAPWWTDLDLGAGGEWYAVKLTDGTDSYSVFSWEGVPLFGAPSSTNSFQIWILDGTDSIWFAYDHLSGTTATVGAENNAGTVGAQYFYNSTGTLPNSSNDLLVGSTSDLKVFTFQAVMNETSDEMILNEVEASDGTQSFSAWAATVNSAPSTVRKVYLPIVLR